MDLEATGVDTGMLGVTIELLRTGQAAMSEDA